MVKPQDILPDAVNTIDVNGTQVRKGTVGAVIANANILATPTATAAEKAQARAAIQQLAPSLIALGMHRHVTWRNPEIQSMIEETLRAQN